MPAGDWKKIQMCCNWVRTKLVSFWYVFVTVHIFLYISERDFDRHIGYSFNASYIACTWRWHTYGRYVLLFRVSLGLVGRKVRRLLQNELEIEWRWLHPLFLELVDSIQTADHLRGSTMEWREDDMSPNKYIHASELRYTPEKDLLSLNIVTQK